MKAEIGCKNEMYEECDADCRDEEKKWRRKFLDHCESSFGCWRGEYIIS